MYEAERQRIRLNSNAFRSKSMPYRLLIQISAMLRNYFQCEVTIDGRATSTSVEFLKFDASKTKESNWKAIVIPILVAVSSVEEDRLVGLRE